MRIGFYISELKNLFDIQTIIYCYSNDPFEAIDVETGECSSFWNIEKFRFCKDQEELAKKWKERV